MTAAATWISSGSRVSGRVVVLASSNMGLRGRLGRGLRDLRWKVLEAGGGAEAMSRVEIETPEALVVDQWLPDLEVAEFATQMRALYPAMDVLRVDGGGVASSTGTRSPRRNELLHAIREALDDDFVVPSETVLAGSTTSAGMLPTQVEPAMALPEMVGGSAAMLDLAKMIRLVAPRSATVLVEGETGTGKEVVAKAVHRLSTRSTKPFVVLNCAAIPESLLEAELFGHTRGAFTGAVQSRTGRIEAAHGGTLFLDEIGEMPLALQAKMLRFLECGEIQRVGDNETMRVDVRVIAATHQLLEQRAAEGTFRLDLYHRLAVFPVEVPALRDRLEDVPALVEHFLQAMGREMPRKRISSEAVEMLCNESWPGNVRELMHRLERAAILCGDRPEIGETEVRAKAARRK